MRWTVRTIQITICGLVVLGAALGHASVTLKISASNPSPFETRDIPLKSYLPKGVRPEHVIDAGGLEIGYDVKRDQAFVEKELQLEAQASATFDVEIEDIWVVEEEELRQIRERVNGMVDDLKDTQYTEAARQIQKNIFDKINEVVRRQDEALIYKVGPTEHMAAYNVNREALAAVEGNIGDLNRLLLSAHEDKKMAGPPDQTMAAKYLQAQRIKQQVFNFGEEGVENACLVDESLKVERENLVLETPETVAMNIEFENPSATERQVAPLRFYLAKEVHASDVVNPEGLSVGFDFGRGLYYVYNDQVELEPGEVKEFNVTLRNKWVINKNRLYGLKVYLENLNKIATEAGTMPAAEEFGKQTLSEIYSLLRKTDPVKLTENRVVEYRNDLSKVEEVRQSVRQMEGYFVEAKLSPELMVMEQELLCREARLVERGTKKDILGLSGILQSRRVRLLAGTIFRGKNLSTADTWKIIWYIIVFLGVISGVFYYVNIRQQKSTMFDTLTGAFARGYTLERLREELRIAKGADNRCSLLVMDIDKFKSINDTHGHAVGDSILKEFVIAIRKGVRATDLVGRFGGDEFMIILPTGEKAIALKIAQSIVRIVEGTAIKVSPQLILNITTSIGVATYPEDSGTAEDLFDKADQALYEVKKRGGNGAEPFGGNA